MRLLSIGPDHAGRHTSEGLPEPHRSGHQRGDGGQSLPLHDLHSNTQGDQARGLENAGRNRSMNNLSPHGFRAADEPSRRGFLITTMGAGVMLGYARRSLADQSTGSAGELF